MQVVSAVETAEARYHAEPPFHPAKPYPELVEIAACQAHPRLAFCAQNECKREPIFPRPPSAKHKRARRNINRCQFCSTSVSTLGTSTSWFPTLCSNRRKLDE